VLTTKLGLGFIEKQSVCGTMQMLPNWQWNNGKFVTKAALRQSFSACVYCMQLPFQINYLDWLKRLSQLSLSTQLRLYDATWSTKMGIKNNIASKAQNLILIRNETQKNMFFRKIKMKKIYIAFDRISIMTNRNKIIISNDLNLHYYINDRGLKLCHRRSGLR